MSIVLDVFLQDKLVGTLTSLPGEQNLFSFAQEYLNDEHRHTLSQSCISKTGELILATKAYRVVLPPFFSNLLPEGSMRDYLAERGNVKPTREFPLLQLLGEDLPGAVTICTSETSSSVDRLNLKNTTVEKKAPKLAYHFSLAGMQLKFSAIKNRRGGLAIPVSGIGGDWIIKLPSFPYDNVPENEWTMMWLARKIGISVPDTDLVSIQNISGLPEEMQRFKEKKAFAVKRFDREAGKKIHIEDFAQVYGSFPDNKYKGVSYGNMANMLYILTGEDGLIDFITRLVFSIMIGNGDMHLKNWSLIYPDGVTPKLAPAYDYLSTVPYIANDHLALGLSGQKDMRYCNLELFKKFAQRYDLPEHIVVLTAEKTASLVRELWIKEQKHFDLSLAITDVISSHMGKVSM